MHLIDLARAPASEVLVALAACSWSGDGYSFVALDEYQENSNGLIEQRNSFATPSSVSKLDPICDVQRDSERQVTTNLLGTVVRRDTLAALNKDRARAIQEVLVALRRSDAFGDKGKEHLMSLNGARTGEKRAEGMLAMKKTMNDA